MRFFQKIGFLTISLLTLVGCNHSYNIFDGAFRYEPCKGQPDSLKGELVKIDAMGVYDILVEDTVLLVYTPMSQELISVYSLNSKKCLYKGLFLRGQGPDECLEVDLVSSYADTSGVKAWFKMNYNEKLYCVNITKSIQAQRRVVEKEIDLQFEDKFALFKTFIQSDTSIILLSTFTNDEVAVYNSISQQKRHEAWLYTEEYERRNMTDMSAGFVYNAKKAILASGMVFFNQVNFYPLYGEKPFSVSSSRKAVSYELVKQTDINERPTYYRTMCGGDELLFVGSVKGKNSQEAVMGLADFIYVFNWEGNILKAISLDYKLGVISYDQVRGYLYGVDMMNDQIVRYKVI